MDDTDVLEIPLARREGEEERVLAWRESELVRAGFHPDVDLHQAIDLIARGCSPPTALRILL